MEGEETEELYFPSRHQELRSGLISGGGRKLALDRHSCSRQTRPAGEAQASSVVQEGNPTSWFIEASPLSHLPNNIRSEVSTLKHIRSQYSQSSSNTRAV